jgi:hypothetical protein
MMLLLPKLTVMGKKSKQENGEPDGLWIAQKHSFKGPRGERAWENRLGGIPSHTRFLELADIALGLKKSPKKRKLLQPHLTIAPKRRNPTPVRNWNMSDLTNQIIEEIEQAIDKLGGSVGRFDLTNTWKVNRVLEFLNADAYLLCTVGSWKDTLSDAEVLHDLRAWNQGESRALKPVSFVDSH